MQVKEELCDNVVNVRRVSDRVMSLAIVFEKLLVSAYAPQSGKSMDENENCTKIYQENGPLIT